VSASVRFERGPTCCGEEKGCTIRTEFGLKDMAKTRVVGVVGDSEVVRSVSEMGSRDGAARRMGREDDTNSGRCGQGTGGVEEWDVA
jgi:hypothetical protein